MKRRRAEDFPGWLELVRGIGIRLRELRLRAGLTQTEAARRLEMIRLFEEMEQKGELG